MSTLPENDSSAAYTGSRTRLICSGLVWHTDSLLSSSLILYILSKMFFLVPFSGNLNVVLLVCFKHRAQDGEKRADGSLQMRRVVVEGVN